MMRLVFTLNSINNSNALECAALECSALGTADTAGEGCRRLNTKLK